MGGVDLVPLVGGADGFEAGAQKLAAGEGDVGVLAAEHEQGLRLQFVEAGEGAVGLGLGARGLAGRAGMDVGGVEAGGGGYGRVQRGAQREVAAEAFSPTRVIPGLAPARTRNR